MSFWVGAQAPSTTRQQNTNKISRKGVGGEDSGFGEKVEGETERGGGRRTSRLGFVVNNAALTE